MRLEVNLTPKERGLDNILAISTNTNKKERNKGAWWGKNIDKYLSLKLYKL